MDGWITYKVNATVYGTFEYEQFIARRIRSYTLIDKVGTTKICTNKTEYYIQTIARQLYGRYTCLRLYIYVCMFASIYFY